MRKLYCQNISTSQVHPSPITHHPSPITHHSSPITHHPSPITHHPSLITHHASPITHHPSRITHHASLITHHPSPITPPSPSTQYNLSQILFLSLYKFSLSCHIRVFYVKYSKGGTMKNSKHRDILKELKKKNEDHQKTAGQKKDNFKDSPVYKPSRGVNTKNK
jgi:hypothetical protein